jgi:hypothetical protein
MAEILKTLSVVLNKFTFKRKKTGGLYDAMQFATPVAKKTRKGTLVIKQDVSEYLKLTEREIDALLKKHEIDTKVAKIYGANRILRQRAAGSGMVDDIISRLHENNVQIPGVTDGERIASGYRAIATSILTLYRDKQRLGKKDWTIDKCYSTVVD